MTFKNTAPRFTIVLLLLVTAVKGVLWSIIIPPWHAPDENSHFEYAQIIERFGSLHPDPDSWYSDEIAISWQAAQLPRVRFNPSVFLDLSDREGIAGQIRRLVEPAIKRGYRYDDGRWFYGLRSFTYGHAPLYYWLAGSLQALLEDKSIFVRILANRWLSVFFGVVAVALAYRAGKELWQSETGPCFLATLVSFQPMMTFMTAVISDGALGIAMLSACTVVMLRVIRAGWTARRAWTLAGLVALGLLARASLIILFPLVMLLLIWDLWRSAPETRSRARGLAPAALVVIIPLLISGWWYKSSAFDFSDTPISILISGIPRLAALPQFLTTYDWAGTFSITFGWYWGNFGWLDTPMPSHLITFLNVIIAIAVWTTMWWLLRRLFSGSQTTDSRQTFMIVLLGIQAVLLVVLYTYLDFHFSNIGEAYIPQGRFYLPAIIGQMTWLAFGLVSPSPARLRHAWTWVVALGMVALNIYSLFSVVTLRYYGARNLFLVAERAAVLQPVSADSILVLCAIFLLLVGMLILALWRAFEDPADSTQRTTEPSCVG